MSHSTAHIDSGRVGGGGGNEHFFSPVKFTDDFSSLQCTGNKKNVGNSTRPSRLQHINKEQKKILSDLSVQKTSQSLKGYYTFTYISIVDREGERRKKS